MNDQQEDEETPNGFSQHHQQHHDHGGKSLYKDDVKNYIAKHDYEYVMVQRLRSKRRSSSKRPNSQSITCVPVISSNRSTDKDSGMGSPVEVDGSRLTTLAEKDQRFVKTTEEPQHKHEWDKKYLLQTYLHSMDDARDDGNEPSDEFRMEGYDELQLYWLQRVHGINKQIQRKEEQILRLHAKVRRHQVKYAFQTKSDVLVQIDRLDTELATQATDIHRIENQLFTANEELKEKLGVLESLGHEFESTLLDIQNWGTLV
ncbi:uncharacterized protein LOC111518941 [Drosophila willistoni]|uniref:uncharacterized protein LOC111518941 n=1 Tax=Drosophila willistoni TaxID=7260 RepID=UPI00017D810D|nr:uncharacterized protein LOC111518941 [Drosophila willistoni]XP_023032987.1 uncharacterized protein LOC111518941 [Drosophila willistoni]